MKYIELIPMMLFCLMLVMDQKHFGKLNRAIKNLENSSFDTKCNFSCLNPKNIPVSKNKTNYEPVQGIEKQKKPTVKSDIKNAEASYNTVFSSSYFLW